MKTQHSQKQVFLKKFKSVDFMSSHTTIKKIFKE